MKYPTQRRICLSASADAGSPSGSRRGFTLVELLVVIGIIVVLVAILLPVLGQSRERARRVACLANVRSLAQAWNSYAIANDGQLISADTWQGGWVTAGNTDDNQRRGGLFPYISSTEVFRCPNDPLSTSARTYSISDYLNGSYAAPNVKRFTVLKRPAQTFVFIEEFDPRGYNLNSFAVPRRGDSWVDYPVSWHNKGCNLSFADGHAEYFKYVDPRTSQIRDFFASTPNNPDLKKLQGWLGYD